MSGTAVRLRYRALDRDPRRERNGRRREFEVWQNPRSLAPGDWDLSVDARPSGRARRGGPAPEFNVNAAEVDR